MPKSIDIVYVLGTGSKHQNAELKYSLRSIVKHLSNVGRVFVVGECAPFLRNVLHLPCQDTHKIPDLNIRDKILAACNCDVVSEDFLFFNDDHFMLKPFDAVRFPNFFKGDLRDAIEPRNMDSYRQRLTNTHDQLKAKGMTTMNFDIHTPIIYNKKKFKDIIMKFDWKVHEGLVVKSLYGNALKLEETFLRDTKVSSSAQIRQDSICFSTFPNIGQELQAYLKAQYSKKSQFEG